MNDTNTDKLLNELANHMREAGELTETGDVCMEDGAFEDGYVLQQKAKLVLLAGADAAYIVPSGQDWAHDALGDSIVILGTIYSDDQPFLEGDASVTGYFQADANQHWTRVDSGRVPLTASGIDWRSGLEDFPEVVSQFEQCMEISSYRHLAEQATLKNLANE